MRMLTLLAAVSLVGCNVPGTSDMPDLNSDASVKAAILKLDPIAPNGDPKDAGSYSLGQPNSERSLFVAWVRRYLETDSVLRMNIDYKPAPLPGSVAEAIADERAYRARGQARLEAQREVERHAEVRRLAENAKVVAGQQAEKELQRQAGEADSQRHEARMAEYQECVRLRERPNSPEASGTYPPETCEQKRDAE